VAGQVDELHALTAGRVRLLAGSARQGLLSCTSILLPSGRPRPGLLQQRRGIFVQVFDLTV
jgi:hypothetical protein